MASGLLNGDSPADETPPSMKPPEHVDGFVELGTLLDIHKCLSESGNKNDIDLATWVKNQYLQEPLEDIGRFIRDSEDFTKLDAAYRRVRHLTGKAQDKWPFYDMNWKKISSTVIKKILLNNVATGASGPVTNGEVRDSPMSNGFDGQHDLASHGTKLQEPLVTKNCAGQQVPSRISSEPAGSTPVSQPRTEPKAQRQDLLLDHWLTITTSESSSASKTGRAARPTMQNNCSGISSPEDTLNGTTSPVESFQDAGAGKVRGPHGRFVNNSKSPRAEIEGPDVDSVKKSRSSPALEGESGENVDSSGKEIKEPESAYALLSGPNQDSGSKALRSSTPEGAVPQPSKEMQSASITVNGSPTSSILAAEAEAVPTSLDRLPPGLVGKKRKSDSNIQRGGTKHARGTRREVIGRSRISELATMDSQLDAKVGARTEKVPPKPRTVATRRSARKSAVSALESPASTKPIDGNGSQQGPQHQQNGYQTNSVVNGVEASLIGDGLVNLEFHGMVSPSLIDESANGISGDAKAEELSVKQANPSVSQGLRSQQTPNLTKPNKRVSFSPQIKTGNVEIIARISTSTGVEEVSLSKEDIVSEVDLVERYAAWQNSKATSVTFQVFKDIAQFAR
ncbi:hypothetical protein EJ07DRAFT_151916 [Lizonia empirigonia]|nr:hypothetical protein EJ07DRAFT_151916 [Lizonia empirigonia]